MWTLVIVVLIATPQNIGTTTGRGAGVSSSISTLDFPDKAKCDDAAKVVAEPDTPLAPSEPPSPAQAKQFVYIAPAGVFRILAKCVSR
jgi:hypothetical protein